MRYHLREVGLEFLEQAPVRLVFEAQVPASRDRVFAAVTADPSTWKWFPTLSGGCYEGPGPQGVGSRRQVKATGVRMRETIMAWDEPERWAYRVDESAAPMTRALLECWEFADRGDQTMVRWTFAADPTPVFGAMVKLAPGIIGRVFRRAMRNLGVELSSPASQSR